MFKSKNTNQYVKAILGPTNTGKTHFAIERMLAHRSGMIGLPLRLLAREVYQTVCRHVGEQSVALVTGEERILPHGARYWIATTEAMPLHHAVDFLAVDEIQTATDLERGHVFTHRILHARGRNETLLLGAATMAPIIRALLPGVEIIERPRLSQLFYTGPRKITRQPVRSAIIAFSASEVYAIAELVRRERGGAAIVMGALSPRTRNAQVALYQNGDVDFLVATDAIGMGLNLDIQHVAFSSDTKFDGHQTRPLTPAEMGQIAGRAGRHTANGTFGMTGNAPMLDDEMVERLQNHDFEPVKILQWRNSDLDFSNPKKLQKSLDVTPGKIGLPRSKTDNKNNRLTRLPTATDQRVLEILIGNGVADLAVGQAQVSLLWDCCQIPDYRDISFNQHVEIATTIFKDINRHGAISESWMQEQVQFCNNAEGDIDTLSHRIKQIRTWTFVANRKNWLDNARDWREKTREIENMLSDALHERLTQRFIDKRTSVLVRHLRDKSMPKPEINDKNEVYVEDQLIGSIQGFRFTLAKSDAVQDAKLLQSGARAIVAPEIRNRSIRLVAAPNDQIVLTTDAKMRWKGEIVAELAEGDDIFSPRIIVLADESLTGADLDNVQDRLRLWLRHAINTRLDQILALRDPGDLDGSARGIVFQLSENFGILARHKVANEVRALDQDVRGKLRQMGIRFGAYHIYLPQSLKPAPRELSLILYALKNGGLHQPGITDIPAIVLSGRTSFEIDPEVNTALYEIAGFKVADKRAVRVDILERLADLIRPLVAFDPSRSQESGPVGAAERNGFRVTVEMTSLLGCAGEDFASILKSLGYRLQRTKIIPAESDTDQTAPPNDDTPGKTSDVGIASLPDDATNPDAVTVELVTKSDAASVVVAPDDEGKKADDKISDAKQEAQKPDDEIGLSQSQSEKTEEPAEEKFDDVWFPVSRRPSNQKHKRDEPGNRDKSPKPTKKYGLKGKKPENGRPENRNNPRPEKKRQKPVDPDSPFAALAALKSRLRKK